MDNSKINQTELSYSCNAGEAKANLYTGRMVLEQNLSTIGMRHYELSLSQIYNSHLELPSRLNSRLGNKWKLNIQQYLYQENYNYYYIDATGMKIEFDLLTDNTYYDKEGLGLQLFKNGNLYTIKDPLDNEMIFQNERLIKTIIKEQTNITQKFEYDNTGKLIRFLNENKIDNKFEFNYNSDNLLNEILVYVKNNLKYKYKYRYDTNKNLLSIKKEQKGFEKVYLLNKYQDNQLIYSVYFEDKSAFKFSYSNNKIIEVKIGVATLSETNKSKIKRYVGDEIYVGEDVYLNDLIYEEDYAIEDCMNEYGVDVLKLSLCPT